MAGDWIKMRMDLPEDPAVYKLVSLTKMDRLSVVGRLYAFWSWADKYAVDGRVDGATSTVVDDVVRFDGFAVAMESVHWLEIGDDFIAIPNHDRHNGESAKERGLKNQRQARWRAGKDVDASTAVDAKPSTPPSTSASTREEKRREEKKETNTAPAGAFDLPSWIPSDTWAAYCKVRAGKKAKNEPHALGLIVKDLERFRSAGHDPVEVLNNSIKSGWAGVFEPKTKPGAQPISTTSADPDSRSAIEAEGVAKGIGPWNEVAEQWHLYKARVRGKQNGLDLTQLAAMAAQRGVH